MATEFDEDVQDLDEPGDAGSPPKIFSGKLIVGILVALGLLLAASAWLYVYQQSRIPREFWGFESPRIFREAQVVSAYLIKPEDEGAVAKPEYYDKLYLIDGLRFTIVKKIDVTDRAGLEPLRLDLNNHHKHDTRIRSWRQKEWRFGLVFENQDPKSGAHYTASIIFDADCKLGRPQTVDKVISVEPMSGDLLKFFEEVFPESKDMPRTSPIAPHAYTQPLTTAPEAEPTATGPAAAPGATPGGGVTAPTPDADVLTLPTNNPPTVSSPVGVPLQTGPSIFSQPPVVVSPGMPLPPGLNGAAPSSGAPGANPGGATPPVTAPPSFQLPSGLFPNSPGQGGGGLDLQQLPRGVTVPPIGGQPGAGS